MQRTLWILVLMFVSIMFIVLALLPTKDFTVYSSRPEGVDFAVPGYEGKFGRTVTAQESQEAGMFMIIPGILGLVGSCFLLFRQKNDAPQPGQEPISDEPLAPKDVTRLIG